MPDIRYIKKENFPESLSALLEIPEPPEKLYWRGTLPDKKTVLLSVVGSRKYSEYGRGACEHIIRGLSGADIIIVSGLALGIDSIAHRAALDAGLKTIAVPGSGLSDEVIYPREHFFLAQEIIKKGGALISEFEPDFRATQYSFPKRNRIMAGLSSAVLVVEAEMRSGTLITARLALDYGRNVYAIPGSIFSENAKGTNWLIKQGATPVTSADELLEELGLEKKNNEAEIDTGDFSPEEKIIFEIISEPATRDTLFELSGLPPEKLTSAMSLLEIKGAIKEEGGFIRRC
ncbi:MAG: DNA-processing protein DprA [Patescibacteria group bacterium]